MNEMTLKSLDNIDMNLDIYKVVFEILNNKHNIYCKDWIIKHKEKINLKRKCVCDVYNPNKGIEKSFKEYMDSYLKDLNCLDYGIMESIYNTYNFKLYIRGRTKELASIIYKLHKKNDDCNGKYPIQKCLNDLLGYRIVDKNYNSNIESIKKYLKHEKNNKYRVKHVINNKNGYKGFHIYFLGPNNHSFPIELQIWNSEDEQNNMTQHKIYKQEYLNWIEDYKAFT